MCTAPPVYNEYARSTPATRIVLCRMPIFTLLSVRASPPYANQLRAILKLSTTFVGAVPSRWFPLKIAAAHCALACTLSPSILGDAMRAFAWRCARPCAVLCSMLSICAATVDQCSDGVCPVLDVPTSGEADAPLFQWDPIKVSYAQLACCGQQSGHSSMRRLGTCADCVWRGANWS